MTKPTPPPPPQEPVFSGKLYGEEPDLSDALKLLLVIGLPSLVGLFIIVFLFVESPARQQRIEARYYDLHELVADEGYEILDHSVRKEERTWTAHFLIRQPDGTLFPMTCVITEDTTECNDNRDKGF